MFNQSPFGGQGPPTNPPNPPDMERAKKIARKVVPVVIAAIVLIILAANSIYTVDNGTEAVVTRFGRYVYTEKNPGLQFKIPFAENKRIVNMEEVRYMEFGFRSDSQGDYQVESLMLTGEEGLVVAKWVVQYRVSSSYNWLFNVDRPEAALRVIGESAYRRVVASHPLDNILTVGRDEMQREIMMDLQEICNLLEIGVQIVAVQLQDAQPPEPVREAFLDVTRALERKNERINNANEYRNSKEPVARGEAEAIKNEAEGYKQKRVNEATGIAARFSAVESEYRAQPEIMRSRLYMEMIREVLPRVEHVYFVDPGGNMIEFLPLGQHLITNQGGGAE